MRWEVESGGLSIPIEADDDGGSGLVLLAHGAGGHMDQRHMLSLADWIRAAGLRVARFNFRYRVLGRSMPDRMPVLIDTYRTVALSARDRLSPSPFIIGGHSMGGRVASMLSAEGALSDGLLLFSYPLHPPGQPEKLRDAHLASIPIPTLCINGTRDDFCDVALMQPVLERLNPKPWTMHWIEGADHSFGLRRESGMSRADLRENIVRTIEAWKERLPA